LFLLACDLLQSLIAADATALLLPAAWLFDYWFPISPVTALLHHCC